MLLVQPLPMTNQLIFDMELSTLLSLTLLVSSIAIFVCIGTLLMQENFLKVVLTYVKKGIIICVTFLIKIIHYFELLSDESIKEYFHKTFSKYYIKDVYYTVLGIYIKPFMDKLMLKLKKYKIISILLIITILIVVFWQIMVLFLF